MLDAVCGIGDNALYVAKAGPGAQVTAVDVGGRGDEGSGVGWGNGSASLSGRGA